MLENILTAGNSPLVHKIWTAVNSPLGILLIGSALGWIFLQVIWEPYRRRKTVEERRTTIREEARFRLSGYRKKVEAGSHTKSYELRGSEPPVIAFTSCLNPAYRPWSLSGLIYAGWGREVYEVCVPLISDLEKEKDEMQAIDALQTMMGH